MRNLYLCIIVLVLSFSGYSQCINNGGFEQGFTGLNNYNFRLRSEIFSIIDCSVDTGSSGFNNLAPSTTINNFYGSNATLVQMPGVDPTLNSLNITDVPLANTGNFAIKLNNSGQGGGDITTMSQFITPNSATISFSFSLIVEDAHPETPQQQPFFSVRLYNSNNEIVNTNEVCIVADENNPIFFSANNGQILYTKWKCARLNIPEKFIGQQLRLEFIMADCGKGGHYGTVYIDDITCDDACGKPVFGLLELDPIQYLCPTTSFQVCGNYLLPFGSTLQNMILEISQGNNIVYTINATSQLTSTEFCFELDPIYFGNNPIGAFELSVRANFLMANGFILVLSDSSSVSGPDISISGIDPSQATVIGDILSWDDISDSYEIEFLSDSNCCPSIVLPGGYYTTILSDNSINLQDIVYILKSKCFRWRIKTSECNVWSPWCCLASDNDNIFPDANFGNLLEDTCYTEGVELCEEYLYATINVNLVSFEQRRKIITAVNTILNGANAIYQAGLYVDLLPDFNTVTGSSFLARIEPCLPQITLDNKLAQQGNKFKEKTLPAQREIMETTNGFTVFPNPTEGTLNVKFESRVSEFTVIDIAGKQLMKISNDRNSGDIQLNLSDLTEGIYFLNADGIPIQKIIKK